MYRKRAFDATSYIRAGPTSLTLMQPYFTLSVEQHRQQIGHWPRAPIWLTVRGLLFYPEFVFIWSTLIHGAVSKKVRTEYTVYLGLLCKESYWTPQLDAWRFRIVIRIARQPSEIRNNFGSEISGQAPRAPLTTFLDSDFAYDSSLVSYCTLRTNL